MIFGNDSPPFECAGYPGWVAVHVVRRHSRAAAPKPIAILVIRAGMAGHHGPQYSAQLYRPGTDLLQTWAWIQEDLWQQPATSVSSDTYTYHNRHPHTEHTAVGMPERCAYVSCMYATKSLWTPDLNAHHCSLHVCCTESLSQASGRASWTVFSSC